MGLSKVTDVVIPLGPLMTSGLFSHWFSQQDVPRQFFVGHSGHKAKPMHSRCDLSIQKCGSIFRAL